MHKIQLSKKPRALHGAFSKKERQKWKSAKGEDYRRRKIPDERKKEIIKQVYRLGFGATIVDIYWFHGQNVLNPREKGSMKENIGMMFSELEKLEMHYKKISSLIQGYRNDPDFRPIFFTQKKLSELRKLVEAFSRNPSLKNLEKFPLGYRKLSRIQSRFRDVAVKYGALQELVQEAQGDFHP